MTIILIGLSVFNLSYAYDPYHPRQAFVGEMQGRLKFEKNLPNPNLDKIEVLKRLVSLGSDTIDEKFTPSFEDILRTQILDDIEYQGYQAYLVSTVTPIGGAQTTSESGFISTGLLVLTGSIVAVILGWFGYRKFKK